MKLVITIVWFAVAPLALEFGVAFRGRSRWTDATLEGELRRFLADREDWPTRAEFEAAGEISLLRAVYAHGGAALWRHRLGMTPT
ncbi:MAG TPA: hypothetical protein VHE14_08485 [Solirubrobacteraceae bacterium]|nr:hypothetical protein [Solirubrobacteraceae bacterium]